MGVTRRRLFTFAVSMLAVAQLLAAPASASGPRTPVGPDELPAVIDAATTLQLSAADDLVPGPVTATATLSPDPGGGSIIWRINSWGSENVTPVGPGGVTTLDLGTQPVTSFELIARFSGYDTYAATDDTSIRITVHDQAGVTLASNRVTAWAGERPVVLTATVTTGEVPSTVTFLDDVAGSVVELGPVPVDQLTGKAVYSSSALRIGVHTITARYDGTAWTLPSTSAPITVTVYADTAVHASFTRSLSTFYPYKDGFKDTVRLGGTLDETATVTLRVYNSSGTLKRSWSLGTKGAGSYGVTWNGRTSSGSRLAAGTYKVKASFKDAKGNTRSISVYVKISWREATWKTGSVITRYGDQFAYYADQETDRLYLSPDYSRGRTMDAGGMYRDCDPCAYVYGKKTFQLTTTAIAYRNVYVTVYGHGYEDREHTGTGYVVNPANGEWVGATPLPEYIEAGVTYNILVPAKYVSADDQVRIVLYMTEMWGDAWDLHYVKLHYQYAVWK